MSDKKLLQIDLYRILCERTGRKLPRWLVGRLEKLICQEDLNSILRNAYPKRGSAFAKSALKDLHIRVDVEGLENLPLDRRLIFASNHPLGGLDGIALISVLGELYGDGNVHFLVNDMLMNVEPLTDVFLPINKYGAQGREAARRINDCYASDGQMLVFPAGLVSRLQKGGVIKDLDWQKAFVAKAIEYGRDIVPVRFMGENTRRFYRIARLRKRLRIGFNLEQVLLPSEVIRAKGKKFRIIFGQPISVAELKKSGKSAVELAAWIKEKVYEL